MDRLRHGSVIWALGFPYVVLSMLPEERRPEVIWTAIQL